MRCLVYADDLQIYLQCTLDDLHATLQRLTTNAEHIFYWALRNRLKLNADKTKAIVFGTKAYVNRLTYENFRIAIGGKIIPVETSVRNLVMILDATLSWEDHIKAICRKANSLMFRLYYFRHSTTLALRKHLVQSLLMPISKYFSVVLCDPVPDLDW